MNLNVAPAVVLLVLTFADVHAQVSTSSSSSKAAVREQVEYMKRRIEEDMQKSRSANLNNNCSYEYGSNGTDQCARPQEPTLGNSRSSATKIGVASQSSSMLTKHRREIVQRCGQEESATVRIVKMEDSEEFPISIASPERWVSGREPSWVITYAIDNGTVVFGEKQSYERRCFIVKKTGQATWE